MRDAHFDEDIDPDELNDEPYQSWSNATFTKSTPVLDHGPRLSIGGGGVRNKDTRWLLWPAWRWRIVAPRPSRRALNVFERAVLGLAQAGVHKATEQAFHLGLDPDLCALIVHELQGRHCLNDRGDLTELGKQVLQKDTPDDTELVTGFLFQDPDSLELWPRFVEAPSLAEVDYLNEQGWPMLVRGTTGNPRRDRLHVVFPDSPDAPPVPDVGEMLLAIHRSARATRNTSQEQQLLEDDEVDSLGTREALSQAYLSRVQCLDEQPDPVFLLTRLYFPQSEAIEAGWRVCDPFGLGDSLILRRHIEARLSDDQLLQRLFGHLLGQDPSKLKLELGDLLSKLAEKAQKEIERRLTLQIGEKRYQSLSKRLLSFERTWQECVEAGQKCPPERLAEVVIQGQKVLEHLFRRVWSDYQVPDLSRHLVLRPQGKDFNAALWEDAAKALGFEVPLPASLKNVKGGKVIPALEHGKGSLRPHLLAALMVANECHDHPLRRAASPYPSLLRELDGLAQMRDSLAHDSELRVTIEEVQVQHEQVYHAVAALLGLPLRT